MVNKSKLSKDVEEQIQSLASDVYIQVEDKLTHLIAAAVKAEVSKNTDQQSQYLSEKEQSLQKDFSEKQQLQLKEIIQLKQALAEKQADAATSKQSYQVELTQNIINYTETIERLEKEIVNLKQQEIQQQDKKQSSDNKLQERLLKKEYELNIKNQEVDGLSERIMVLTEQEQSLTIQLTAAKEQIQLNAEQQSEAVTAIKIQAEASVKQQVDALTEKIQKRENDSARIQAETRHSSDNKIKGLEQNACQLAKQVQQEKNGKADLQQQLLAQQKSIDTERDKNKQAEQKSQDYQVSIIKLTEQTAIDKQQFIDEIKSINEGAEQVKKLQAAAQQNIIELEKTNEQLNNRIETETNDIKLYQQEITGLNEQVKVAQEGKEDILKRFNRNREKQEIENNNVRETIKFLRDENHQLISDNEEQKAQFSDKVNELEYKLTEYRLKFEYAQKQLTN